MNQIYALAMPRLAYTCAVALLTGSLSTFAADAPSGEGVKITKGNDNVRIDINGQLFTEYWFKGNQHPAMVVGRNGTNMVPTRHVYFWPLIGPGGVQMVRGYPITN